MYHKRQTVNFLQQQQRKSSIYDPDDHAHHHVHHHYHPHFHHDHPHMRRQVSEMESPPIEREASVDLPMVIPPPPPAVDQSRYSVVESPPSDLCFRHSLTPIVPAPHGWSYHESVCGSDESAPPSERISPHVPRQRTVGSGENYGFIYGDEESAGENRTPASSAASSLRSSMAKPVKCPQVTDSCFKTEAVIEVDRQRGFSMESTKSAPDVIATH